MTPMLPSLLVTASVWPIEGDTHGLPGLLHLPDTKILQGNNPTGLLVLEHKVEHK